MGVYEGRGQLTKQMRDLLFRWQETKGAWDDPVSKKVEEQFIVPLEQHLKNALSAMDHMGAVLQQAKHDCSE
jgi:hypothetical protein